MIVGEVFAFAGSAVPALCLLCDGTRVSQAVYADLFAVVGFQFGPDLGDGTFALPDLMGRFARFNVGPAVGTTGGEDAHLLTVAEMPDHGHGVTDPGHNHTWTPPEFNGWLFETAGGSIPPDRQTLPAGPPNNAFASNTMPNAQTGVTVGNAGGGGAHENRPAFLHLLPVIFAGA